MTKVWCERSAHLRHTNTPGRQLRLSVSNVSKDLCVSMETITIVQVRGSPCVLIISTSVSGVSDKPGRGAVRDSDQ